MAVVVAKDTAERQFMSEKGVFTTFKLLWIDAQ